MTAECSEREDIYRIVDEVMHYERQRVVCQKLAQAFWEHMNMRPVHPPSFIHRTVYRSDFDFFLSFCPFRME